MKYLKTYEALQGITFKDWLKKNPQPIDETDIDCYNQNLIDLEGIQDFKNLQEIYCHGNKLTSLDLEGLDKLQILWCEHNQLTSLNLEGLDKLEYLSCRGNQLPYTNLEGYWKWYEKEYPDRWEAMKFNLM